MLSLTNAQDGEILVLNVRHIVSIREHQAQVFVQVSTGVEYAVKDKYDNIAKRDVWNRM